VLKYADAMATNEVKHWEKSVAEEHERMEKHEVFGVVSREDVPANAKILTSTWAMKKKANGKYRA
jgi:hypothetical protein